MTNQTNQGFIDLHNPMGFFIVGVGFLLVMLIVAAGGIFSRMIERDHVESRRQAREAMEKSAEPPISEDDTPLSE